MNTNAQYYGSRRRRGAGLLEYAFILVLALCGVIAILKAFQGGVSGRIASTTDALGDTGEDGGSGSPGAPVRRPGWHRPGRHR